MKRWLFLAACAVAVVPIDRSQAQTLPIPATTDPGRVAPVWTLTEDLRVGGADAGPSSFSDIRGLTATKAGTIFVLDYKAQELRVFDANGAFLRVAAKPGDAAGQLGGANGLAVGPDDAVWVSDPPNNRFSIYRPDGQFARALSIRITTPTPVWGGVIDQLGRAVDLPITVVTARRDPATQLPIAEIGLRVIHPDGKADTLAYPVCGESGSALSPYFQFERADGQGTMIKAIPFLPKQLVALTRTGTVWCEAGADYRLTVGPVGLALKEVVRLSIPPLPIPAEERRLAVARIDSIVKAYGPIVGGGTTAQIPKNQPYIVSLNADDQSRAWVRRAGMPDEFPFFDVFDGSGSLVATVHGAGPIGSQLFIAGDHLITVTRNAKGASIVVRYKINRS